VYIRSLLSKNQWPNLPISSILFGNLDLIKDQLSQMSLIWLIANTVRLVLVGATLGYAFKSYLLGRDQKG